MKSGMPGGGNILSTSNSIYTEMSLKYYEFMLDIDVRKKIILFLVELAEVLRGVTTLFIVAKATLNYNIY